MYDVWQLIVHNVRKLVVRQTAKMLVDKIENLIRK